MRADPKAFKIIGGGDTKDKILKRVKISHFNVGLLPLREGKSTSRRKIKSRHPPPLLEPLFKNFCIHPFVG
jgi:hypothetical protein